ncbi:MAG: ABC transporter substrate-binding protein [Firmicutes bacterium]|nr:ABC transporter substrate-binding protein [Bacillota bacterium]
MRDKLDIILYFLKRTWPVILVSAVIIIGASAGVEIYKEEVLNIDPDVQYKTSTSLSLSCEPLDTLNPILSQSEDVYHLSKLLYNSLFDYDETLNVVPELVDKYTVDRDRGKVTITLKEGIKWHNGNPLKATDVNYTINAIKNAGTRSLYYEAASKISYVYVRDTYKLELYFRNAYDASLDDLTFPILPSGQYGNAFQLAQAEAGFKPVGTGQYQYQSYNYLKQLRLKPNEEYWGTAAKRKLKIMILPEKELSPNMMEIESVTCYVDESSERRSTVIDKNFVMYDMVTNDVEFLIFHPKSVLMRDKEVRQAAAFAINEQNILSSGYMGDAVLSDTIYFPDFCGVADEGDAYAFNPEKAKELLKEKGIADIDNDGILEDGKNNEVILRIAVNKKNSARLAAARLIEKDLDNLGFKAELDELTWDEYKAAVSAGKHDIIVAGFSINEQYDLRDFYNGRNEWKYYNDELFNLANEIERLYTSEEYTELYRQLKDALLEELPYYSLCYKKAGLVGIEGFKAGKISMFNDHYRNIETWSWTYAVEAEKQEQKTVDSAAEEAEE